MPASGHERRFRELYAAEGRKRLNRLAEAALALEDGGGEAGHDALVEEMFRDAHSLKGGAAVVGLEDLARVAHALEDVLDTLRGRPERRGPLAAEQLLSAVDVCRDLLEASLRQPGPAPAHAAAPAGPAAPALGTLARLVTRATAAQVRLAEALDARGLQVGELDAFRELNQLLTELADGALQARSVAVEEVAAPLQRALRDAARRSSLTVRWEQDCGATRLDAAVLDGMTDGLVHVVRNAVVHGIEPSEERERVGKPAQGTVRFEARQRGAEIWLTLRDDGRGVDLGAMARIARERGRDPDAMSRAELLGLLLEPGVSTAATVTDLAGRGVGLGAVHQAALALGGRVDVETEPGAGTECRIVVPASLHVSTCLVVDAGGSRVGLPLRAIDAVVPAPEKPGDSVEVAGQQVPCAPLDRVLGLGPLPGAGHAVVVRAGDGGAHAFAVGALLGRHELVVSGLGPPIPPQELVTGASPQADGSIVVVLDPEPLVRLARAY